MLTLTDPPALETSTSTCPYCKMVKDFLKKKGIIFENIDVAKNKKAADELLEFSGQMGVPVTILEKENGEKQTIIGFDQQALKDAFKDT